MKSTFLILTVLCLALMFATADGIAQERRTGTNGAAQLLIPVGARYIGMGGAPIATVEGAEAIFWNPAGADRSNYSSDVMFSHMSHIADIGINYAALRVRFSGLGTVAFSLKALDIGDIPITTEFAPDGTGSQLNPQFITAGLSYSRGLTDRISVGATINLISETLDRVTANTMAFDFGVQYRGLADIDGLSVGIVVKNLGPSVQYGGSGLLRNSEIDGIDRGASPTQIVAQKDELPSFISMGLSYNMSLNDKSNVVLSSSFSDNNFQDDAASFGLEYSFDKMFYVRGGYSISPDARSDAEIYGLTLGAGFHTDLNNLGITIDYAYRDVEFFDSSNVFTLQFGF